MTHGDDSGLILPPRVAPTQVILVPIPRGDWKQTVLPKAKEIASSLREAGVRIEIDDREEYKPGWKFSEWEMRGVPLRLEIGPKDIEQSQVILVRRDTGEKLPTPMEGLSNQVTQLLETIQAALFERAINFRNEHTHRVGLKDDFVNLFKGRPGYVVAPWCGGKLCEAKIKEETQATIRNIPFDASSSGGSCISCGEASQSDVYFAKSY